jgi:Concanavalin A-like lectin/glucanases superfamily
VWTAGKYGTGLRFSGGVTYDGVNLAPNNGFDALTQGTLEAWVKFDPTAAAGYHDWFDGRDASGCSYPFEFEINNLGSTVYWEIWAGNTAQCTATFNARVALSNPSQWHHLAYVVTSSGNTWYVDGLPQSPTYIVGSAASTFFFASIAASPNTRYDVGTSDDQAEVFQGIVDELRIYNRPLSPAEIQADMSAPISGVSPHGVVDADPSAS